MHDEYTRSDFREKSVRASRRDAALRHKFPFSGKRGSADKRRWGGKVPISHDPDFDYSNEVGGLHSHEVIFRHWEGKDDGDPEHHYIERWLEGRVGRPWNDVWAEICAMYDSRSYVGYAVRKDFTNGWRVERDCYISIDGNVRTLPWCHVVSGLYIHPETGVLCCDPYESYKARNRRRVRPVGNEIEMQGYSYVLRECGTNHAKNPYKNRIKAWFYEWTEVVNTPYWHTHSNQDYPAFYYETFAQSYRPGYGWGEWRWNKEEIHHSVSCTRKQMEIIRKVKDGGLVLYAAKPTNKFCNGGCRPWKGGLM